MANGEEAARKAEVAVIMKGGQDAINEYLVTGLMNLQENGCAKACSPGPVEKWTPHAVVGGALTALYAIGEWIKSGKGVQP